MRIDASVQARDNTGMKRLTAPDPIRISSHLLRRTARKRATALNRSLAQRLSTGGDALRAAWLREQMGLPAWVRGFHVPEDHRRGPFGWKVVASDAPVRDRAPSVGADRSDRRERQGRGS